MIDDRLTEEIEAGAVAKPRFSTEVITTDGGWEVRNRRWAFPLHQFEFNVSPSDANADLIFEELRDLYYAAAGQADAFKFKHWSDFEGTAEAIGTGDASDTTFQLIKNYTRGAVTQTRKITRPVLGTVLIYLNGVLQGSGYTVDYDTGIVTFTAAPGLGVAITATFEFDVPVRFADDEIDLVGLTNVLNQAVNIVLVEVKE